MNYGGSKNESSLSAPEIVEYSLITCCCCMTSGGTKENIMKEWKIPWEEIRTAFKSHNFRVQFVEVGRTYLSLEETIKAYLKNLLESECFLCIFLIPRRVEGTSLDDGVLILVFAEETSHHSSKRSYFYGREQSKRIIKSVKGENQIIVDQQICKNESPLQALEIDQYRVVRGFCAVILCHRLQNFKEEIRSVFECLGFRVLFVDMGTTNFSLAEAIKMCFKHQDAKFGCFLCLVLGPRNGGKTLLGDAKPLALQEIANIVGGDKCPSLADKPKVVIWQMDATPDSSCCESMKSINDLFTDVRGE